MPKIAASVGVVATLLTSTVAAALPLALPTTAQAQGYYTDRYGHRVYRGHGYARGYDSYCRHERRSAGNKGTVAGALVGGASGALIGGDVLGGLVGAGVGAVAGHEIAKHRTRC